MKFEDWMLLYKQKDLAERLGINKVTLCNEWKAFAKGKPWPSKRISKLINRFQKDVDEKEITFHVFYDYVRVISSKDVNLDFMAEIYEITRL